MENTFVLIVSLFREFVRLIEIAEHEVAEREVAERDCFYLRNCLFFYLFLFNLFLRGLSPKFVDNA